MKKIEPYEEFSFRSKRYYIGESNKRMYAVGMGADDAVKALIEIVSSHPEVEKIKKWSDKDIEDSRSLLKIHPGILSLYRSHNGSLLAREINYGSIQINSEMFPSLEMGEEAKIDDILRQEGK